VLLSLELSFHRQKMIGSIIIIITECSSFFNAGRQLLGMNGLAAEIAKLLLPRGRKDVVHERRSAAQDAEAHERRHYG
jgi:hypothetical protein